MRRSMDPYAPLRSPLTAAAGGVGGAASTSGAAATAPWTEAAAADIAGDGTGPAVSNARLSVRPQVHFFDELHPWGRWPRCPATPPRTCSCSSSSCLPPSSRPSSRTPPFRSAQRHLHKPPLAITSLLFVVGFESSVLTPRLCLCHPGRGDRRGRWLRSRLVR